MNTNSFALRHIGPREDDQKLMLESLGLDSMEQLIYETVPDDIRLKKELDFLVKKYDPNLIYFVVDTFLAMSNREFDELKELYSDYVYPYYPSLFYGYFDWTLY